MDILELIGKRHSYRGAFLDTPVPREHLRRIMEVGLHAPSGCNLQTTSLIGVDDPALLKTLGQTLGSKSFYTAPAAVCVLTQETRAPGEKCFNIQDYSAAIENMLLAVVALGYESCWIEGKITTNPALQAKMAALLSVPEDAQLVAYLPIGRAADAPKGPDKKSFDERAWFNGYKNKE